MRPWLRNFLTRCLAIVPSLIVALIGGSAGAGKLIIIASVSGLEYLKTFPIFFYDGDQCLLMFIGLCDR